MHLDNLALAFEIVRLVFSLGLSVVAWKLYNLFKPGTVHKQWLFIILGNYAAFFAGLSAVLNELGIIKIAQEKILVSLVDIIFLLTIYMFAVTFLQAWTKMGTAVTK